MKTLGNAPSKQKFMEVLGNTQALQVVSRISLAPTSGAPIPALPKLVGPMVDPPRKNTSLDMSG
ncbi:UNVERIFIED_CONTAM: hypothetical protein Sangu_2890700 [Sesamum angustifolium]|uniref:Uncharacterized protein n=1 Tax=Sesamum angustifolium TaxID=2727405 RepID=A0AAW2IMT6_9LAMI